MTPVLRALVVLWLPILLATPVARGAQGRLSARQILDAVDDLYRGRSSRGRMQMTVTTTHWQRTLSVDFWSKGKDQSLFRIRSPKKEAGTATLRSGTDIWNYLPKIKRVIKLPSSMMAASWMGSHFTNDDLIKESRMADDYTFEITFEGERDGDQVMEVTCVPKPEAAVVWGKVVVHVQAQGYMPRAIEYFDEDLTLARTMTFEQVATLGGRMLPTTLTMTPADKPGESTVVHYDELDLDFPLDDELFSLRALRR